jgi:hypothetical protein
MNTLSHIVRFFAAACLVLTLAACGGGGGYEGGGTPPTTTVVGAAGGTVSGPPSPWARVAMQPTNQVCTVINANIASVGVDCVAAVAKSLPARRRSPGNS